MAQEQTSEDIDRTAKALRDNDPPPDTRPPVNVNDSLGINDAKMNSITSSMASNLQTKMAADDKVFDQMEATQAKVLPKLESMVEHMGVEAGEMKPWNADVEAEKRRTDPITAFGSFGSVFGIIASAFTRSPMVNALNASAAAMDAIKAGDEKSYERAYKAWQDNTKQALDRHKIQHDAYSDASSLLSTNMTAANTKLQVLAARFGDQQMLTLLNNGMSKEVQELLGSRQKLADELALNQPKVVEANAEIQRLYALGYDPKNPQSPESQEAYKKFRQEKAELKRTEHTYGAGGAGATNLTTDRQIAADVAEYRKGLRAEEDENGKPKYSAEQVADMAAAKTRELKQKAAAPTSNRIDDLRGKVDQTDNILNLANKNVDFLEKYKGGAGLMGKIMRGEEIAENIAGVGSKTDRVQFRRNVLELQEIVPRILTDSNGRPLASAQEKVDSVVAGLAAGDTGPNTLRAYRELIEMIKKRQQDYRGRIEGGYDPGKASSGAGRNSSVPSSGGKKPSWMDAPVVGGDKRSSVEDDDAIPPNARPAGYYGNTSPGGYFGGGEERRKNWDEADPREKDRIRDDAYAAAEGRSVGEPFDFRGQRWIKTLKGDVIPLGPSK